MKASDRSINFPPWVESHKSQTNFALLNSDGQVTKLNPLFAKGTLNLPKLYGCTPQLVFWGIHPDAHLANHIDLGDFPIFLYLLSNNFLLILINSFFFVVAYMLMNMFFDYSKEVPFE